MYEVKSHHIPFVTEASEFCKFASQPMENLHNRKWIYWWKWKHFRRVDDDNRKTVFLGQDAHTMVKTVWHLLLNKDIIYVKSFAGTSKYITQRVSDKVRNFRRDNNSTKTKEKKRKKKKKKNVLDEGRKKKRKSTTKIPKTNLTNRLE